MNPRERILAMVVVIAALLIGGGFLVNALVFGPLQKKDRDIARLQDEIDVGTNHILEIQQNEIPSLHRWRTMSMPVEGKALDVNNSTVMYERLLTQYAKECGLEGSVTPKPVDAKIGGSLVPKGPPIYQKIGFSLSANCKLENLVQFLEKFYNTGLLHQVRTLSIQRRITPVPGQSGDLDVNMTIEALALTPLPGEDSRHVLQPVMDARWLQLLTALALRTALGMEQGPLSVVLLANAISPRRLPLRLARGTTDDPHQMGKANDPYMDIAKKDIFMGPAPTVRNRPEVPFLQYVTLTSITGSNTGHYAELYDVYNNQKMALAPEHGTIAIPRPESPPRPGAPNGTPAYIEYKPVDPNFRILDENRVLKLQGKVVKMTSHDVFFQANDLYYCIHVGSNLRDAMKHSLSKEELAKNGIVVPAKPATQAKMVQQQEDDQD